MKIVVIATLFAGLAAFANPPGAATAEAAKTEVKAATDAVATEAGKMADKAHGKMGHATKAMGGKPAHADCKEKNADGTCKTEMKK
jgi:hypothetical protein